jgi:hypothetical protein
MNIEFRATESPDGLEIVDPIEQRHLRVDTPEPVDPIQVATESFTFPVQRAVAFDAGKLRFDQLEAVWVHDADGETIADLGSQNEIAIEDAATYELSVGSSIKLYVRLDGPFTIRKGLDNFEITLDGTGTVAMGARSLHERPAATVGVTDDPASLARGVSLFASALKTLSPERTYPTLRGHPPRLERRDAFANPAGIERPDSGITIYVPDTHRSVATVASLAFYLAADVAVPADTDPRVVTDSGFEYALADDCALEDGVARLLKQQFLLDCVVRTEGLFPSDLYERDRVEDHVPFDIAATYDADLQTRFERYTRVDYDAIEPALPEWPLTAHVPDSPDIAPVLPHVADELGVVRADEGRIVNGASTGGDADATESDGSTGSDGAPASGDATATGDATADGTDGGESMPSVDMTFVEPARTDESLEHAWFGEHVPQGASKPTLAAFENQFDERTRLEQIEIVVVCNDPEMLAEQEFLDRAYKNREELPYDVVTKFGLDADELATVLTDDGADFLHYIGHATTEGLRCIDGKLDVRDLPGVDVRTFLLNACQSHRQAMALVERGAYGGVGTLGDVVNDHAIEIGKLFAYLLNLGFPLRAAIDIVSENTTIGEQYLVAGDGSVDIIQSTGGNPLVCNAASTDTPGRYAVDLDIYPTNYMRLGSQTTPSLDAIDDTYIVPTRTATYDTPESELREYLSWMQYPTRIDGVWKWNREYSASLLE